MNIYAWIHLISYAVYELYNTLNIGNSKVGEYIIPIHYYTGMCKGMNGYTIKKTIVTKEWLRIRSWKKMINVEMDIYLLLIYIKTNAHIGIVVDGILFSDCSLNAASYADWTANREKNKKIIVMLCV